jgi:translation initiation factor 2 subunit 3
MKINIITITKCINKKDKHLNMEEIMEIQHFQPTINIGMIGHVANGKSTIVKKLTGITTQRHAEEQKKNLTMKLGYANTKIFKCPKCLPPMAYQFKPSKVMETSCMICDTPMKLERHISFVDCPGHHQLMSVMLNGACVMDSALLIESVTNIDIPSPQTLEHYIASDIADVPVSILCLNKMDLIKRKDVYSKIEQLRSINETLPFIPLAANFELNIDVLCEYLCTKIPHPIRDLTQDVRMVVIRSFNVNKNKGDIQNLKGGVLGGSLQQGVLHENDNITILPGCVIGKNGDFSVSPLHTKVVSIHSEKMKLEKAIPGGLLGVQTTLDSGITAQDRMVGSVVLTEKSKMLNVYNEITVSYKLIKGFSSKHIKKGLTLIINSYSANIRTKILSKHKKLDNRWMTLQLIDRPVCGILGDKITMSIYTEDKGLRLSGMGTITDGIEAKILSLEDILKCT